ncbi:MAG: beta-ketoacyl synthase N-terminal-like domain-containing protein, partial [Anaerolineaceae bacterium]
YPERKLDPERVAVIFGNSNAGEGHYRSTFRLLLPEYLADLQAVPDFANLPAAVQKALLEGITKQVQGRIPVITEDTMPGELSNIISGRVANVFNFSGPNFVTDAACASSIAAVQAACEGLLAGKFDAVLTGGIDRSMGPESYIKFCKIGALSADGSRPYAEGANGFVMGEGAVVFLLKRLEDAERDNDRIYAVIRGIGASSDGKGKGITAPNPLGQQRAIQRAWIDAGVDASQAGLIEGHGTSTKVGDVAEVNSLNAIFGSLGLPGGSVMLGSVKSNIGHLKSAAGAAGLLKTILALHHQVLPPSANFRKPNPDIPFGQLPFRVNTQPQEWEKRGGQLRFAGVSAFGFGGTNFHVVLEEYFPGVNGSEKTSFAIPAIEEHQVKTAPEQPAETVAAAPAQIVQSVDTQAIQQYVLAAVSEKTGYPAEMLDPDLDLEADLGIDTVKQAELFASIRTHYDIPRRENLRLSEYNTLAKVVGFVADSLQNAAPALIVTETAQPVSAPVETAVSAQSDDL